MKIFLKNPLALSGLIIILTILILALVAPIIAPYDPNFIDINSILFPPSINHLMGTDGLGRDVFSRMLYGAQISLLVGFVAVGIATLIGVILGSLAGFYRGWVDSLIMRFVDIMLSIPTFFSNISCNSISYPINMEYYDRNWLNIMDGRYKTCKS